MGVMNHAPLLAAVLTMLALGSALGFFMFKVRRLEVQLHRVRCDLKSEYASVEDMYDLIQYQKVQGGCGGGAVSSSDDDGDGV